MRQRRRTYLSILGLGVVGLIVDKTILGSAGPTAALAATVQSVRAANDTSYNELRALLATPEGRNALTVLDRHSGGLARDVFTPGTQWMATQVPTDEAQVVENPTGGADFRVTSVVLGRTPVAMINGRTCRVGDVLEKGVSVVAIDAGGVLIARDDIRVRLPLSAVEGTQSPSSR
ncbi:MAG: hypothetical protein KF866_10015 [Phycisphaeraceae bacterium]|nr:hypothetical protein [Phycisphaeraceae bacterium]MCW5754835.1 hypothetical protein [Phycisphaeraceae bacterium]